MADQVKKSALDFAAQAVCAPSLAAAFVLYFLVTWVPDALCKRDLVSASLLLAGTGAGVINLRGGSPGPRLAGAAIMAVGLLAAVICMLW